MLFTVKSPPVFKSLQTNKPKFSPLVINKSKIQL